MLKMNKRTLVMFIALVVANVVSLSFQQLNACPCHPPLHPPLAHPPLHPPLTPAK